MAIIGACKICGRSSCTSAHYREPGAGLNVRPSSRRGLPLEVYETPEGETLRLNKVDARRRGLIPPEEAVHTISETVTETGAPIDGRVGEVLAWAGEDRERLQEAIDAERGGRNRPTLLAELERRLGE